MPTVLIIEDDADLLFLYRTALLQNGYEVLEAHNSASAIEVLESSDPAPDLVVIDMVMPDAPGTRVINFLRGDGRFEQTQIVIVTANEQYRERVADKGIAYFMVKPINVIDLVSVAEQLLS